MIYNIYKYELLSIIEMILEDKNYDNNLPEFIKNFSPYIKDLELSIDNTTDDIEKELLENNDIITTNNNITKHLLYLKKIIKEDIDY